MAEAGIVDMQMAAYTEAAIIVGCILISAGILVWFVRKYS